MNCLANRLSGGKSLQTTTSSSQVNVGPAQRTTVRNNRAPFSWGWVWASFAGFVGVQFLLGNFAGDYLLHGYKTAHFRYLIEGGINLGSYYLGGFLIGFFSPRVRLLEPAVAAGLAMLACLSVGWFTPVVFYQFGFGKFILGGGLAALLAYAGAFSAERFTGQVKEDDIF